MKNVLDYRKNLFFGRKADTDPAVRDGLHVSSPRLLEAAQAARTPPPPEELVGALQDSIHLNSGRALSAKSVKFRGSHGVVVSAVE